MHLAKVGSTLSAGQVAAFDCLVESLSDESAMSSESAMSRGDLR
jgi:hypothetical protein